MTSGDVLELFREHATTLGEVNATQTEIISRLAQLLADSRECLSNENFEDFVHIGAVIYQENLGRYRARTEVTAIMAKSAEERRDHH